MADPVPALRFGLISGAAAVLLSLVRLPFIATESMETADFLGYLSMVVSALFVFFGIRFHRERLGAGRITFGRGLLVGLLITLISCGCYAVGFEIIYFQLAPDFGEAYSASIVDRARAAGAAEREIEKKVQQARRLKALYDNPWTNALLSFSRSFPVGLAGALVSAAILRRN